MDMDTTRKNLTQGITGHSVNTANFHSQDLEDADEVTSCGLGGDKMLCFHGPQMGPRWWAHVSPSNVSSLWEFTYVVLWIVRIQSHSEGYTAMYILVELMHVKCCEIQYYTEYMHRYIYYAYSKVFVGPDQYCIPPSKCSKEPWVASIKHGVLNQSATTAYNQNVCWVRYVLIVSRLMKANHWCFLLFVNQRRITPNRDVELVATIGLSYTEYSLVPTANWPTTCLSRFPLLFLCCAVVATWRGHVFSCRSNNCMCP